jgi:protein-disulfide isomerase
MGAISTFVISRFCPFCIIAYALSFITFACTWFALRNPPDKSPPSIFSMQTLFPLVVLAGVSILSAVIADNTIRKAYGDEDLQPMIQEALQSWSTNPELKIVTVAPLVMGASDDKAKMVITEFADFRCTHCKHAAPVFKAFVNGHPDVQLQFEAWPLDGECNTSIPTANGASCLLARTVNCVQKNNSHGWLAHEYIYEHQDRFISLDAVRGALTDIAKAAGSDEAQVKVCVDSPEAIQQLRDEAAVGSNLSLTGTPTVFVNGRKLLYGQNLQVLTEIHNKISSH